jgi:molecular chaperone GrpE
MSAEEKKRNAEAQPDINGDLGGHSEAAANPELENELHSTIDRLQRLQAEFENYKKRALRDAVAHEQRITDCVILDFLPLYDNMQLAFESLASNQDRDAFVAGVELIFAQFRQILESHAVHRMDVDNQPFDPALHEAMLCVPHPAEENMVIEEIMPGYMRGDRVLRPSRVAVSQGPSFGKEETE